MKVATRYRIRELADGLSIVVQLEHEQWQRLLMAGLAGAGMAVFSGHWLGGWWWTVLSPAIGWMAFKLFRYRRAELWITKLEFCSKGDIGRRIHK